MAEIRIENRDDLEKWLNSLPENIRRQAAVAIASRAALRVLPVLENWLSRDKEKSFSTVLRAFHATATTWIAMGEAHHSEEIRKAVYTAARTTKLTAYITLLSPSATDAVFAAYAAIHAASNAFQIGNVVTNTSLAVDRSVNALMLRANDAIVNASAVGADIIAWNAVEIDSNTLANDLTMLNLLQSPLWLEGTPDFIIKLWNSIKARLLAREGEHWEVWTNWYDARLDPSRRIPCYSPPDMELERQRVLLPDELWEQGPAAVNARIKELIEESGCAKAGEGEDQAPAPYLFGADEQGRIVARPYHGAVHDAGLAAQLHEHLKSLTQETLERLQRTQAPARVHDTIRRLRDVLGEQIDDIEEGRLLLVSRALEADVDAYDTEAGRQELAEDAFAMLRELALVTSDLRAQFAAINDMLAHAETQKVLEAGVPRVLEAHQHIVEGARELPEDVIDHASVLPALEAADAELHEVEEAMQAVPDERARARFLQKQAQILAIQSLTDRNFVARLARGMKAAHRVADNPEKWGVPGGMVMAAIGSFMSGNILTGIASFALAGLAGWQLWRREIEKLQQDEEELQNEVADKDKGADR